MVDVCSGMTDSLMARLTQELLPIDVLFHLRKGMLTDSHAAAEFGTDVLRFLPRVCSRKTRRINKPMENSRNPLSVTGQAKQASP